jgi:hypothetical protein
MARRLQGAGAAILLVALLAVAGCGGGGSDSVSTTTLTKDQWVRKAFAVCRRLGHEQQDQQYVFERAHGMKVGNPGQRERERLNTVFVMSFVERKIDALRTLPVPEGEQAKIERILKSMEEGIRVSKAHPDWLAAPTKNDPNPFEDTLELTAAYGIWDCGQP